jgi:hypothetical protein
MTTTHARRAGAVATLALAALVALPGIAFAATNAPIAATGGMSATLPILGGVVVTVALDPAGNVSGVTVSNATLVKTGSGTGFAKFATADGRTRVAVKAKGSEITISARVAALAGLTGSGSWSANVFGNGVTSASYTIAADGAGRPTLTLAAPSPLAAGVTFAAAPTAAARHTGESRGRARAGGQFAFNGFVKTLGMVVAADMSRDGAPGSASLKITLSGADVQRLAGTLASLAAAGQRTWSAYLCDGTTKVTVTYHVNADGTIGYDGATGAPAAQRTREHGGLVVRFAGTGVGFSAKVRGNGDGTFTLVARGASGNCGGRDGSH